MPRLIIETDGVLDLEGQLLNGGGTGECCVLGDEELQEGLVAIPEPSDEEILSAEEQANESLENTQKRMYAAMQDPGFSPEDMMIFAKIAKDNQLHTMSAPGIAVALLNKLTSMLSSPTNTPRDLLFLEQSRVLMMQASEPTYCTDGIGGELIVKEYKFDEYGTYYMEELEG